MCNPQDTRYVYVSNIIVYLAEIDAILTLLYILLICKWQALRRYCNSTNGDRSASRMIERIPCSLFTSYESQVI